MRFRLLGEVQALRDGQPIDIGPLRQHGVLAALLVEPNVLVTSDQLVDRVWGGKPPPTARGTLSTYFTRLRQALPEIATERMRCGFRLVVDPTAVDLAEFRAHAEDGQYEQALDLWRGEPLNGLRTLWAEQIRDMLTAERFAAVLGLAEQRLRAGRHADAVAVLTPLAADHPLDERLAARLMEALSCTGRNGDALHVYERLRRQLGDELGVDPNQELQRVTDGPAAHSTGLCVVCRGT